MARQPEGRLSDSAQRRLRAEYGERIWIVKQVGNAFTRKGIPDLLISVDGRFCAIELKQPNGRVSVEQRHELAAIDRTGATAAVARSIDEVLRVVALAAAGE